MLVAIWSTDGRPDKYCLACAEGSAEVAADGTGDSSHVIICSAAGVGCSGRLRLLLTWRAQSQLHPDIDADLTLHPLQVVPDQCD